MLTLQHVRTKYLDFFKERDHMIIPSDSLLPLNDPTTLFTGSGMQPMIPFLLGNEHPLGTRLANSQRCFRSQDIEEVGDSSHTTYFEMLGNWSLGDYFKQEQLRWIFEFLVHELGLPPEHLKVTVFKGNEVFPQDEESIGLWRELFSSVGIEAGYTELTEHTDFTNFQIFGCSEQHNWWSRAGLPEQMPPGEPGGPDSEIFFDFGPNHGLHERHGSNSCGVTCPCGRFLEIGNSVFMNYRKQADGSFQGLIKRNIDFGGGLERICAALNSNPDIFKIDVFSSSLDYLNSQTQNEYDVSDSTQKNMRIVLDHLRSSLMLINDGVLPSPKERGYVLRRLLRRSLLKGQQLGLSGSDDILSLTRTLCESEIESSGILLDQQLIETVIHEEIGRFQKSLTRGLREFDTWVTPESVSGERLFFVYETFG
ncbi:MAG: hypothetical protein KDD62_00535, partial [Bdellovibrionales bacterium]|nr:hypothetical protein [Bdellovibrionales bacterium]